MKELENFVKMLTHKQSKPKAKVVGSDLVVALPDANQPSVWKTNLDDIRSASFELESGDSVYKIVVRKDKDNVELINAYQHKEDAVLALNTISKALLENSGKISLDEEEKPLGFFKSFIIFLAFFFLILMVVELFSKSETTDLKEESVSHQFDIDASKEKMVNPKEEQDGVPLSADDVLGGR